MSKIKRLVGQTVVYGVSSILGRLLNYALVFLHTDVFTDTAEMGKVTGIYAYATFLIVFYTFGMETGFFRFSSRKDIDQEKVFHVTGTAVLIVSLLLSALVFLNASAIAKTIGYPGTGDYLVWLSIAVFIDAVTAIPFARLRLENKAWQFATAKIGSIVVNVAFQVICLKVVPDILEGKYLVQLMPLVETYCDPSLGIGYIFLANLTGNIALLFFLWRPLLQLRLRFEWAFYRPILQYAFPILITGLAGMANEQLSAILLEWRLPDGFHNGQSSTASLGVYGQTAKLSIFMMLALQAFRYAGEPFFFSNAADKNAPALFAKVMHYFVVLTAVIFVSVSLNVDLIGQVFLRSEGYREALYLVPILLFGKLFYGIYVNLGVWFKLTDRTRYGTYFTLFGAVITFAGNYLLIPVIGYVGCAITSVACYASMVLLCYLYGRKYFPIPYRLGPIIAHIAVASVLVMASFMIRLSDPSMDSALNLLMTFAYLAAVYFIEKRKWTTKTFNFS